MYTVLETRVAARLAIPVADLCARVVVTKDGGPRPVPWARILVVTRTSGALVGPHSSSVMLSTLTPQLGQAILSDLSPPGSVRFGRGDFQLRLPEAVWTLVMRSACWACEGRSVPAAFVVFGRS
jgi:hypothetical protein